VASSVRFVGVCAAVFIIGVAADLDQYRGFRLGSSTPAALFRIHTEAAREAEKTRSVNRASFTP
jgi:hypothetical protein